MWGLSQGFDCEYPLEMHVRPFSKFKLNVRLALRQVGEEEGDGDGGGEAVAVDGADGAEDDEGESSVLEQPESASAEE